MSESELAKIYQENVDHVFRYSLFKIGQETLAEDVTQETFARFIANLDKLEEIRNIRAWLITTARNVIYETYRKESKELNLEQGVVEEQPEWETPMEDQVISEEMIDLIKDELGNLNDIEREIVVLKL